MNFIPEKRKIKSLRVTAAATVAIAFAGMALSAQAAGSSVAARASATIVDGTTNGVVDVQGRVTGLFPATGSAINAYQVRYWKTDIQTIRTELIEHDRRVVIQTEHYN
jgi:hypothetical protein